MRPMSDAAKAILKAANELSKAGRGVTLAELAAAACVGRQCAKDLVPKLKQRGHLRITGQRRIVGRNRTVAEYGPALVLVELASGPHTTGRVFAALHGAVACWVAEQAPA